jgi:hypothetical protein
MKPAGLPTCMQWAIHGVYPLASQKEFLQEPGDFRHLELIPRSRYGLGITVTRVFRGRTEHLFTITKDQEYVVTLKQLDDRGRCALAVRRTLCARGCIGQKRRSRPIAGRRRRLLSRRFDRCRWNLFEGTGSASGCSCRSSERAECKQTITRRLRVMCHRGSSHSMQSPSVASLRNLSRPTL